MKKILVTGGAGFIGSHLCKKLVKEGHDVICLDNYFTGSKNNIIDLIGNPHFELVRHDITEPYQAEVDYIFNLACPASPIHYQFNPVKTVKTSVMGAINMLELAEENGATVLQASTSEVYGDPIIHPQVESYWGNVNPIGIRSCYDEGKRCAETLFMDYHRQKGVNIKIIRIFNTYGPNMHPQDGRVVSNFIMQAINNKDITIYGTGKQTRSFMYIDDLLDGMIKFVRSDKSFIGPLNIGNSHEFTISQLAEMVIKLCDSDSKVVYKPLPGDDPKQRQPDISLAVEKLGWKPEIHLEEGLIRTIDYFRKICR
jgi:UDP-glucuronate decarboxylase